MSISQTPNATKKVSQQGASLLILTGAVTAAYFLSGIVYEYVMVFSINHHAYLDDTALDLIKELKTRFKYVDRTVATVFGLIVIAIVVNMSPKKEFSPSRLIWKCVFIDLIFLAIFGLVRFYFFSAEMQKVLFEFQISNSLRPGQALPVLNSDKYLFDYWGVAIYGSAAIAVWWLMSMTRSRE